MIPGPNLLLSVLIGTSSLVCMQQNAAAQQKRGPHANDLPLLRSSFNGHDGRHVEAVEKFIYKQDELNQVHNVSDFMLMGTIARAHSLMYSDIFLHRYDTSRDMERARGAGVNNELCVKQLEELVGRAALLASERYNSRDINLFQLMDTWGRPGPGMTLGNMFAEGMYHECKRLKIVLNDGKQLTRYCVASIKHKHWPQMDRHDILAFKVGICIPRSCDSINYKNKYELLMRLLMRNMRALEQDQLKFHSLYCLPDEDSPLRSIGSSPKALATLTFLCLWLALLVFCTHKHRKLRALHEQQENAGAGETKAQIDCPSDVVTSSSSRMYKMLSIEHNLSTLFSPQKKSMVPDAGQYGERSSMEFGAIRDKNNREAGSEEVRDRLAGDKAIWRALNIKSESKIIDLSCIEGLKVIAMAFINLGHVVMIMSNIVQNIREMNPNTSLTYLLSNMTPAYAVNTFFTITGLLTSYLMLKQNQTSAIITSPGKWLVLMVYRYMRIMPMYALVVLYCKTLAKYTGAGPLWDYATSSLGQRRTCEQEPWSHTLLFGANLVPPLEHCVPGGWYLANDFQFFLATPFFLVLLHKQPRLGQLVICGSVIASNLAGFHSILSTTFLDSRPIALFAPHGFKTYVSHFSANYTQPQYRIPAYLIGLLIGYHLFVYERNKLAFYKAKQCQLEQRWAARMPGAGAKDANEICPLNTAFEEPCWSDGFKRWASRASLLMLLFCHLKPILTSRLPLSKWSAHFIVALLNPACHIIYSVAVGLYLLLATTGQANRYLNSILAANCWKPLAKVNLCAMLINIEVISYLVQSDSSMRYVNNQFQASVSIICLLVTYGVAVVACVLFEAPIRAALNALFAQTTRGIGGSKHKSH